MILTPNTEELPRLLEQAYCLQVDKLSLVTKGHGSVKLKVDTSDRSYCLRINHPFFSSHEQADLRGRLLRNLKGIHFPAIISVRANINREHLTATKGNTYACYGGRTVELYEWLPAKPVQDVNNEVLAYIGKVAAALDDPALFTVSRHNCEVYQTYDFRPFVDAPLLSHVATSDELIEFQEFGKMTSQHISAKKSYNSLLSKILHGDFQLSNICELSAGVYALFDFESVTRGLSVEDVLWMYADICKIENQTSQFERKSADFWQLTQIKMTDLELDAVFDLLAHRHLRSYFHHLGAIVEGKEMPFEVTTKHRKRLNALANNSEKIREIIRNSYAPQ